MLEETTVKLTPDLGFNGTQSPRRLRQPERGGHSSPSNTSVPDQFQGAAVLGWVGVQRSRFSGLRPAFSITRLVTSSRSIRATAVMGRRAVRRSSRNPPSFLAGFRGLPVAFPHRHVGVRSLQRAAARTERSRTAKRGSEGAGLHADRATLRATSAGATSIAKGIQRVH